MESACRERFYMEDNTIHGDRLIVSSGGQHEITVNTTINGGWYRLLLELNRQQITIKSDTKVLLIPKIESSCSGWITGSIYNWRSINWLTKPDS
jgi:hypothetical protein